MADTRTQRRSCNSTSICRTTPVLVSLIDYKFGDIGSVFCSRPIVTWSLELGSKSRCYWMRRFLCGSFGRRQRCHGDLPLRVPYEGGSHQRSGRLVNPSVFPRERHFHHLPLLRCFLPSLRPVRLHPLGLCFAYSGGHDTTSIICDRGRTCLGTFWWAASPLRALKCFYSPMSLSRSAISTESSWSVGIRPHRNTR